MTYNFDTEVAKKYGVNESIMLNNFIFWIKKNIANNSNNYDDNWWTFNSARALKDLFPFWSESQIRRILKSLIEQGVLIEGNYNKMPYDRTKWYAISKLKFEEFHLTNSSNGSDESVTPIPDNKPDDKQYSKPDNTTSKKRKKSFFTLSKLTSFDNLTEEYVTKLKEKIEAHNEDLMLRRLKANSPLSDLYSYQDFENRFLSNGMEKKDWWRTFLQYEKYVFEAESKRKGLLK